MATIRIGIPDVPWAHVEFDSSEAIGPVLEWATELREAFLEAFPNSSQTPPAQPAQRAPQGNAPVRGQRETRADKYPVVPGMQCDICGGPVGRYPKTGRMTSDKGVCLGRCKDGQYVHTVGWLNDEPDAEPF